MANVTLRQLEDHTPWQPGEIVTVKVTLIDPDGDYVCETLETFPADLKEKHAAALADLQLQLEQAKAVPPPAPVDVKGEKMPVAVKPPQILLPDQREVKDAPSIPAGS